MDGAGGGRGVEAASLDGPAVAILSLGVLRCGGLLQSPEDSSTGDCPDRLYSSSSLTVSAGPPVILPGLRLQREVKSSSPFVFYPLIHCSNIASPFLGSTASLSSPALLRLQVDCLESETARPAIPQPGVESERHS